MIMKKYILILFVLTGLFSFSQEENKPVFEINGEMITATYFHDNGTVHQQGSFSKDGQLEGLWISYDFQGNKLSQGYYSEGSKTGQWLFWTENSLKEVDFSDSKIINVNEWRKISDVALNLK